MSTDAYELKAADFAPFAGPGWGELRGRNRVVCQVISLWIVGSESLGERKGQGVMNCYPPDKGNPI